MFSRFVFAAFIALFGTSTVAFAVDGSEGGLLESLPSLKDFKAARQSSYDPSGGNADGRQDKPIQPNETRQLAKMDGPGAVTHIWVTIASKDPNHLKNLVLRMYWDGEEAPSVECPIGDFFGLGHSKYYQYACMPIQIGTNNALNSFWRMPFSNGALVTVTNEGPVQVDAFYYYVDYQTYAQPLKDTGTFHAQYRQQYPCAPGQNYVFFEATGRGHYVGCNLSIHNRADGWWGEGDDMIYIDGEEKPTFNGTGSEDYFCGAWCYGPAFSDLFLGCPLRGEHKRNELWNVYRYHLADPIPFAKSIRVTIEHGHANDRSDDFSSVGYWYQTEPHAPFPALPAAADRMPQGATVFTEAGAIEMEDMAALFGNSKAQVQDMSSFSEKWSNAGQLWFTPDEPAVFATVIPSVGAEQAGKFDMQLWSTLAPDYGIGEIWLNGERVCQWDAYRETVARGNNTMPVTIKEGDNTLEVRIVGKNEASRGYFLGLDCVKLTPAK